MKNAILGSVATLITASLIALANLYVQVQVQDVEILHLTEEIKRLQKYFIAI